MAKKAKDITQEDFDSWQVVILPLDQIIPYENNPRNIDQRAVDAVVANIKDVGVQQVITVDKNNVIIAGHTRLKAAYQLGMKYFPCKIADNLSKDQANRYRINDNKSGEIALWDYKKLQLELAKLDLTHDSFEFNFTPTELESLLSSPSEDKDQGEKEQTGRGKKKNTIHLSADQYLNVMAAINHVRTHEPDKDEGEALANICREWMQNA